MWWQFTEHLWEYPSAPDEEPLPGIPDLLPRNREPSEGLRHGVLTPHLGSVACLCPGLLSAELSPGARMGREQDLILAVKNGDVTGVQKLVAKVKATKTSEYWVGRASR